MQSRQHGVDLVPGVVVRQQVGVHHLPDGRLLAAQIDLAGLQTAEQLRARLEIKPEDGPQTLEGRLYRLVEWALGIDAMDDVNGAGHRTPRGRGTLGLLQILPVDHLVFFTSSASLRPTT